MGGPSSQQSAIAGPHVSSNEADTGDAVMARWLQSAGLQHLAAPLAAAALDHRLLPSLLMQVRSHIHSSGPLGLLVISLSSWSLCIVSLFGTVTIQVFWFGFAITILSIYWKEQYSSVPGKATTVHRLDGRLT